MIAFVLLAVGGIGGIVGWIVGGGVPKRKPGSVSIGPLPRGIVGGIVGWIVDGGVPKRIGPLPRGIVGGIVDGGVGGIVDGGVGDGPLPPGWDPGVASHALSASFLDSITFSPSKIFAATSFCFTSVTVQATCL